MKTFLILLLFTLSAQAQLTLRSAAYVPLLKAPAAGGGSFDPITSVTSATNLMWLDTTRWTSGLSDGDPVTTWTDYGPSGRNGTQSTGGYKPTFKTAARNGLDVVRFDGSDDWLDFTDLGISGANPYSVVMVGRAVTIPGFAWQFYKGGNGNQIGIFSGWNLNIPGGHNVSGGTAITNWMVITYVYDGSVQKLYTNTVATISESWTLTDGTGAGYIGRGRDGYFMQWDSGVTGVYQGALSDFDRLNIWTNLSTTWSIPATP